MNEGDRVEWRPERRADWAGNHKGALIHYDAHRANPGPAYEIKLDNGLTVWAPIAEVFAE